MTASGRIIGRAVPPLLPTEGPVHVLLVGEAPGPRGADKSGVPFFGDGAGQHLYRALEQLGAITLPSAVHTLPWDGQRFADAGLVPAAHRVALGNAFDRCPTNDGHKFRAPSRAELEGVDNMARLARELDALEGRGLRGIVTMGRVATRTVQVLFTRVPRPQLVTHAVPHPSAQGLLSMAPNRGKGARMSDLQEAWMRELQRLVIAAGYPAPEVRT